MKKILNFFGFYNETQITDFGNYLLKEHGSTHIVSHADWFNWQDEKKEATYTRDERSFKYVDRGSDC